MTEPSVRFRMWFLANVVTRLIKAPPISLTEREVGSPRTVSVKTRHGHVRCLITGAAVGAPLNTGGRPPVHVNFHGGAFLIGNPAQDDHLVRGVAGEVGAVVVNVDYTTAPKATFPRAQEEAFDVLQWVATSGDEQGWDGTRISIGGGSAGAHLAMAALELARQAGGPPVRAAVLICPLVDLTSRGADLVSTKEKPMVSEALMNTVRAAYFPVEATQVTVLASPTFGERVQFTSLPPLLVVAGELDALRTQIEKYVSKAEGFGVPVTFRVIEQVDHDFPLNAKTPEAIRELGDLTREHLLANLA
jgi:acetyl esterase